jgi:hypothetical protein
VCVTAPYLPGRLVQNPGSGHQATRAAIFRQGKVRTRRMDFYQGLARTSVLRCIGHTGTKIMEFMYTNRPAESKQGNSPELRLSARPVGIPQPNQVVLV